ncbi:MAG TPA: hypothetical protein VII22_17255 [Streptosporangiaceae bacterium]
MTDSFGRRNRVRAPVLLSYAAFVFVGVSAGVGGVLLLAQMSDYGVDRATIGITFFTGSAGFVLAGLSNGALIQRFGIRMALAVGGGAYVLAGLLNRLHAFFGVGALQVRHLRSEICLAVHQPPVSCW